MLYFVAAGGPLGQAEQRPYPVFNTPRTIVWVVAGVIIVICWRVHRRNMRRRLIK